MAKWKSRNDNAWQKSSDALTAAQDARTAAVRIHGPNSPEALATDELAWAEHDRHFGTYGNPHQH